jgi:hypothetical protein
VPQQLNLNIPAKVVWNDIRDVLFFAACDSVKRTFWGEGIDLVSQSTRPVYYRKT